MSEELKPLIHNIDQLDKLKLSGVSSYCKQLASSLFFVNQLKISNLKLIDTF